MGVVRFKYCPKCGDLFDCYCESLRKCWCFDFTLSANTLKYLAEKYSGCICPKCLQQIQKKNL